jgi:GntR family transcriptional regulator
MIDKSSGQPLYNQLEDEIAQAIEGGSLPRGAKLPSERELCHQYSVSRQTVRLALNALAQRGFLHSQPGKGTYVAADRPVISQVGITTTGQRTFDWSQQTTRWLSSPRLIRAPHRIRKLIDIPSGERVVYIEHVQVHHGIPVNYFKSWIPEHLWGDLPAGPPSEASIIDLLLVRCGLRAVATRDTIGVALASPDEAAVLAVKPGSAVGVATGCFLGDSGTAVEVHRSVIRGDRFHMQFLFEMSSSTHAEG